MKAAVLYETKKPLVVEEIDVEDPKEGEVMVRTAAAGVCHSDLHFIEGLWPFPLPAVLGHEASGIVEKVGEGITHVQPGDHAVLSFIPSCGTCYYCTIGRPVLCSEGRGRGGVMKDGTTRLKKGGQDLRQFGGVAAFAEYMVVSERSVIKIREDAPLDKVSVVGCAVMTGVGAVTNTVRVEPGSSVAVIGAGGVGLNVIQGAALAGAAKIIAVDLLDNKLKMAEQFGATHTVNGTKEDPLGRIREITGGGADYAFEVIGNAKAIAQAFDSVRPGGTAVAVGMAPFASEVSISTTALLGEKVLRGSAYGSTRFPLDIPRIIDLYMAGRLKLDELITREYPLEDINDAFAAMKNGEVARSIIKF